MKRPVVVLLVLALVVAAGVVAWRGPLRGVVADLTRDVRSGIDVEALPAVARDRVPDLETATATSCPRLPVLWLAAVVEARSGWQAPTGPTEAELSELATRSCSALDQVTTRVLRGRVAMGPLDAVVVCLAAGCPGPGTVPSEAVAVQVARAVRAVRAWSPPPAEPDAGAGPVTGTAPLAFPGHGEVRGDGCSLPDPTGPDGCLTPRTSHLLLQVAEHVHRGPVSCWDEHAWNPSSDHPLGRACDWTIGRLGTSPGEDDVAAGWALATWLRAYAEPLGVRYVIWQGRIWSAGRDSAGWRPYDGGGVYDAQDVTGGHFDHVHVSVG